MVSLQFSSLAIAFAVSLTASVAANWIGVAFAERMGMFAVPSARRRHGRLVPLSGGLWIFIGALAGAATIAALEPEWTEASLPTLWRLAVCLSAMLVLGWYDDRKILSVRIKFLVQLGIGALAMTIPEIQEFSDAFRPLCGLLIYPLVLVFITGITNAVNFIDGADGLLASILMVSFSAIVLRGFAFEHTSGFAVALAPIFLGGILGFLFFNWRPAHIFMGDTGSLTLGFALVLCCLALGPGQGHKVWEGNFSEALSGVMQLGYPILDLLWVITKRLRRGFSPFRADQNHLHHCLMRLGFSVPKCVIALASLNLCLQIESYQVMNRPLVEAWPDVLMAAFISLTYIGWIVIIGRWKTRELGRMASPEGAVAAPSFAEVHEFVLVVQTQPLFEGHHMGNPEQAMQAIHSLGFLLESNCPKGCQVLWQSHNKTLHLMFPASTVSQGDVKGLHGRIQGLIDNWIEMFNVALSAPSLRVSVGDTAALRDLDTRRRLRVIKRGTSEDTAA